MTKTVDELRNEIRSAAGRFEREISASFTKEDLAAICTAVDDEVDPDRLPPTAEMRARILRAAGVQDETDPDEVDRNFRKAELEAIADALGVE